MSWVAVATIGAGVVGAGATAYSANKAAKAGEKNNAASQAFVEQTSRDAFNDAKRLYGAGSAAQNAGNQAALDVFGQAIPEQMSTYLQGNTNAQNQLSRGAPQIVNALKGAPIDYSAFAPQQINTDTSWAQQTLPDAVVNAYTDTGLQDTVPKLEPMSGALTNGEIATMFDADPWIYKYLEGAEGSGGLHNKRYWSLADPKDVFARINSGDLAPENKKILTEFLQRVYYS